MITLENIDLLFDELLRRKVVDAGYLPDESIFGSNLTGYEAAKDTLRTTLAAEDKTLIDVIGVGSSFDRVGKDISRFVIDRKGIEEGTVGSQFVPYHNLQVNDKYNKYRMQASSSNVTYDVRLITNNITMERVMLDIINNLFQMVSWLPFVNIDRTDGDELLEIRRLAFPNVSIGNEYIEHVGNYIVKDVYVFNDTLESENIAPIMEVNLTVNNYNS